MKPYIIQYKEAIERGWIEINGVRHRLVVGWKIKKVIEILCGYLEDDRFIFDPTSCYRRFEFEETLCLQGKRPYYNKPIELMLWQKVIFEAVYSFFEKSTGLRLVNICSIEVGRKNGKSTMMAADVNHDLFVGPEGTRICVASNEDKTAKFIWSEVAGMRKRLDLKDEATRKNLAELSNDERDITVIRMSGRSVNDGDNFYKVIQDEAWDCKTNELPEACERSCSTQPDYVYFIISTNGTVNNGWYDDQLAYANAWLNGEVEDLHYLPFLFEQDDDKEIFGNDRDVWQKANPSLIYGVKKWAFIENNMIKAKVDKKTRLQLMCKDFNIKISNSEQWLTSDEYSYEQEPFTLEEFRHSVALGATDLSDTGDLTTASIVLKKANNNNKYVVMQFFIPESKLKDGDYGADYVKWSQTINPVTGVPYVIVIKGNRIDQKVVADWYQMLRDKFEIETYIIGYDKWNGSMFEHWCDKKTGYGFNLEIIRQGKYLSFAMRSVERDLYDRLINYGDNPVLKYCFNNTSAEFDEKSDSIQAVKIDGQYSRKIDGVVTLIMLYQTLINNEIDFENYRR